jgi:hypothetical protein
MFARIERPEAAALVGGALVMLGAWLPWLTLFAGLQRYGGLLGIHGRVLFAGGGLVVLASLPMMGSHRHRVRRATVMLGLALLGFDGWLLTGLARMLHHDVNAMLVPRAGSGLFVATLGIALVILGPGIVLVRDSGALAPGSSKLERG